MTELADARLARLENQAEASRAQIRLRAELQQVEVFVRRLEARAAPAGGAAFSTWTSACTSACFSSAACLSSRGVLAAAAQDPEMAGVFATLHRRGVETLGEEGFMDAIIAKAQEQPGPVLTPFIEQ